MSHEKRNISMVEQPSRLIISIRSRYESCFSIYFMNDVIVLSIAFPVITCSKEASIKTRSRKLWGVSCTYNISSMSRVLKKQTSCSIPFTYI